MRIDELLVILFEGQHRRLQCLATHLAEDEFLNYWLLRHAIPMARFLWREAEVLHAGAVEINGATAAFLGPCGGGKSTLVRHLIDRGHRVMADDHLLLRRDENGFVTVLPSIPFCRDTRDLEDLGCESMHYHPAQCALGALYLLQFVEADANVRVCSLPPSQAAIEIMRQALYNLRNFGYRLPKTVAAQRLEFLAEISRVVPVRRLEVPRSLQRIAEVSDLLKCDFSGIVSCPK
jgi:hypothetical protein